MSRCRVYTLNILDSESIQTLLDKALQTDEFLKERHIQIEEYDALIQFAAGDARKALNLLDLIASTFEPGLENIINNAIVVKVAQQNIARYDKSGEQHYDLVSAFIKSIREVIRMQLCTGWPGCLKVEKIRYLLHAVC